jgi:hypothetical protein
VARIVGTYVEAAETLAVTWKGGNDVVIAGCGRLSLGVRLS